MTDNPNPEINKEPNLSDREKAAVGEFIDQTYELNSIRVGASEQRAVTRALKDPKLSGVNEADVLAELNAVNLSMEISDQPNVTTKYMAEEYQRFVDKEQHYFLLWQNNPEALAASGQATDFVKFACTGAGVITLERSSGDVIEYRLGSNVLRRIDRLSDGTTKSRALLGEELVQTVDYIESALTNIKDKVYSHDYPPNVDQPTSE